MKPATIQTALVVAGLAGLALLGVSLALPQGAAKVTVVVAGALQFTVLMMLLSRDRLRRKDER